MPKWTTLRENGREQIWVKHDKPKKQKRGPRRKPKKRR